MLSALKHHWFLLGLFAVIILGTQFPALGITIKPWINSLILVSMLLIGYRIRFGDFLTSLRNRAAVAVCLCAGFVVMPLLSLMLAWSFFSNDPDMYVGVVLAGAIPTTQASSIVWTDLARGNRSLALVLMGLSNLVGVFLSPILLSAILGTRAELPVLGMITTLFCFIFAPALIGMALRARFDQTSPQIEHTSRIVNILIVWAIVLTALSSGNLASLSASTLGRVVLSVILQYSVIAFVSFWGARSVGLTLEDSLAVMFCSSQVTLTVATLIGFSYFAVRSIVYVVVYHLFQQLMGQLTARYIEKRA